MHGITGAFINGWQNQAIITVQTGAPYSINSSSDTAATGVGGEFADRVPGQPFNPAKRGVQEYFNTAAFVNAAPGTLGTTW